MIFAFLAQAVLITGSPASVGMSQSRLEAAAAILASEVQRGDIGAASLLVARRGAIVLHRGFGRLSRKEGSPAVKPTPSSFSPQSRSL